MKLSAVCGVVVSALLAASPGASLFAAAELPSAAELHAIAGREKKAHSQTVMVSPPLGAAESQALLAKIQTIRRLLLATPTLQALRGHDWATFARIEGHEAGRPLRAHLGYIAYPYWFNARLNRAESSAEGAPFTIDINDVDAVLGNGGYLVDEPARFTFAPRSAGLAGGFPAYFPGENFVVITKDDRPLFVPVTEQQYLEVRVRQARQSHEETQRSLASLAESPAKQRALAASAARLSALETELASLTEAERRAPALDPDGARTRRASALAEPGAAKTRAIVTPNPRLFDPKLPRTAVQLIVLGSVRYQPDIFGPLATEIDKAALRALLD